MVRFNIILQPTTMSSKRPAFSDENGVDTFLLLHAYYMSCPSHPLLTTVIVVDEELELWGAQLRNFRQFPVTPSL
jgi:hypothetical protein